MTTHQPKKKRHLCEKGVGAGQAAAGFSQEHFVAKNHDLGNDRRLIVPERLLIYLCRRCNRGSHRPEVCTNQECRR